MGAAAPTAEFGAISFVSFLSLQLFNNSSKATRPITFFTRSIFVVRKRNRANGWNSAAHNAFFLLDFMGHICNTRTNNHNAKDSSGIMNDKKNTSYPKEKINILFLENISDTCALAFLFLKLIGNCILLSGNASEKNTSPGI